MLNYENILLADLDDELSAEEREALARNTRLLVETGLAVGVEPGEAMGLSQDYFDAVHEMAGRYYGNQRYAEAVTLFSRLVQLKPTEVAYLLGLGACMLALERYEEAELSYTMACKYAPLEPEPNYYLGLSQYFQKKYSPAFDNLRFARVLDEQQARPGSPFGPWCTQLLERLLPLVPPEQAARIDQRP